MSYFDLGSGLGAFQKGYDAARELAQKDRQLDQGQQQADYMYPRDLYMGPPQFNTMAQTPLNAMQTALFYGTQAKPELPQREVYDFRGGGAKKVTPTEAGFNYEPQSPEAPYLPDESRMPAGAAADAAGRMRKNLGGINSMAPAVKERFIKSIAPLFDGTEAARWGLQMDPDTGAIHGKGPSGGRQVKEYMDYADKIIGSQAAIFAAAARPDPTPRDIVIPDRTPSPRGQGRPSSDKEIDRLIKQKQTSDKMIEGFAKKAGIKGTMKAFDPKMLSPDLQGQYQQELLQNQLIQQRLNRLQGMGPEAGYTAPAAPQKDPSKIMQSPNFKSKVQERMKAKGENQQAAEQFILKKLGY